MNLLRYLMVAFVIATRPEFAAAATEHDAFQEALGGIVANQTTTVAGHEFFKHFYALWNDKPLLDFFVISVRERPSARRGNRIVIEYAQRALFETALPTTRAGIQSASERAVQLSYDSMVDTAVQRLLFREQDLAADEF